MIKVKKPEIKTQKFNLENEEKPIVEPLTMTSEDVHGGDEVTQSVDDQRFAQQEPSPEQETKQEEQAEQELNKKEGQNETEPENAKKQEQEYSEEQEDNEKQNETGEQEEGEKQEQGQEGQNEEPQAQSEENGEEETEEGEEYEEENETESEEESKEYEENSKQAFELKKETIQHLHLELYRLIEYMSDEAKVLTPEPVSQTQSLNVKKLLFRQFEKKPLNDYYYYRERTETILVLDNSGSMQWLETTLNTFFTVALKRRDVQVFLAPNGVIEEEYNTKTRQFEEIDHEIAMKKIIQSGLPVIYLGDFDGADTPIELSWHTKVYWICTETRYKYFEQHSWVSYHEEDFHGFFGRAWNIKEIIQVLQEFSKHIQQPHFWLDLHKDDIEEPEDDE